MGVAASLPRRAARRQARPSVWSRVGALHGLVLICVASFVLRAAAGLLKATPIYYPDEYMYAELGRSLAENGRPMMRGADAAFPALLQPLLTAPAWLLGDVADAYRVTQLLGALAMSLAAVPVFFLALRLGLSRGLALGTAALAVAFPALMYSSWVLAEPFAYPLFLTSVYAGTVALTDRSRRAGLAFVFLAGLTTLARSQFFVLPACFLAGVLMLGVQGRSLVRELRAQALPLMLFSATLVAVLAAPQLAGMYHSVASPELVPADLARRVGTNAMGLMYGAGWILVPGALLGIVLALGRARSRVELAFGTLAATLTIALLLEGSLFGDVDLIQERYTFYAAPLLALCFALWATRGWPGRRAHAVLAAGALLLAMLVPLSGYTAATGKMQSPFLFAGAFLEERTVDVGTASLVIALAVALLSVAGIGVSMLRPQARMPAILCLALAFCVAASAAATAFDIDNADRVSRAYLPTERSWVDRSGLEDVALLQGYSRRTEMGAQLFWNRSVDRVLVLPDGMSPDPFATEPAEVGRGGELTILGRPVRDPLLVDEWGSLLELRGATPVAAAPNFRLWKPTGAVSLAFRFVGYFRDGWLSPRGDLRLWPTRPGGLVQGTLAFELTAPGELRAPATLRLVPRTGRPVGLRMEPGSTQSIVMPVCTRGPWLASFTVDRSAWDGERFVSVRSTRPRFSPDPSVCG
jgi:hypothetical protein